MNIVIPPVYNLSMSIVISEVTDDGILVSADKRITDSENGTYEDTCIKAFPVGGRVVIGITGKRVEDPKKYKRVLDRYSSALTGKTVKDCAKLIAEVMSDFHDLESDPPEVKLIVSGYDENKPAIYEIHITNEVGVPVDRTPRKVTDDPISYDLTSGSLKPISKRPYSKTSSKTALKNHRRIITEVSEKDVSVSEEFDSYLIKPDGITYV